MSWSLSLKKVSNTPVAASVVCRKVSPIAFIPRSKAPDAASMGDSSGERCCEDR